MLSKTDKAGGIFKSVNKMTRQVEEFRVLSERGLYLVPRMPLLSRYRPDLTGSHNLKGGSNANRNIG